MRSCLLRCENDNNHPISLSVETCFWEGVSWLWKWRPGKTVAVVFLSGLLFIPPTDKHPPIHASHPRQNPLIYRPRVTGWPLSQNMKRLSELQPFQRAAPFDMLLLWMGASLGHNANDNYANFILAARLWRQPFRGASVICAYVNVISAGQHAHGIRREMTFKWGEINVGKTGLTSPRSPTGVRNGGHPNNLTKERDHLKTPLQWPSGPLLSLVLFCALTSSKSTALPFFFEERNEFLKNRNILRSF